MATRKVMLTFPEHLIKEPVLYSMALEFRVVPNIRRARVTETFGEIAAELSGDEEDIEAGVRYIRERGVQVEPITGDIVSP